MKPRIDGKQATYVATEASKRGPIQVDAAEDGVPADGTPVPLPAPADRRKARPALRNI